MATDWSSPLLGVFTNNDHTGLTYDENLTRRMVKTPTKASKDFLKQYVKD